MYSRYHLQGWFWKKNRGEERRCERSGKGWFPFIRPAAKPESPAPFPPGALASGVSGGISGKAGKSLGGVGGTGGASGGGGGTGGLNVGDAMLLGRVCNPFLGEKNFGWTKNLFFNHPPLKTHIYPHISYPSLKSYPNKKFQLQLVNASFYGGRFVHFGLAIHLLKFKMDTRNHQHVYRSYLFPNHPPLVSKLSTVFYVSSVLIWASLRWRPLFWCRNGLHLRHWDLVHPGKVDAGLRVAWWLQPRLCLLWTEILMEYAQPDMQFWKNYRPYPLNWHISWWHGASEKKMGCCNQTTQGIETTWGVASDELAFTVFDIPFG